MKSLVNSKPQLEPTVLVQNSSNFPVSYHTAVRRRDRFIIIIILLRPVSHQFH